MAMALTTVVACLLLSSAATTSARFHPSHSERDLISPRALPDSPSRGYKPATVECPSARPTIRAAQSLSSNETEWLTRRRAATVQPMTDFLVRANITGFDAQSYINGIRDNTTALPNIGIAVSGGGYRALMNGAGFVAAADNRTAGSLDAGGIGGLLQASTYLAGLSGGGWLVGSIYSNNFSTVVDLRDGSVGSNVWRFNRSIFSGPEESGISILNTASYWSDVAKQVSAKDDAGYNTSITDYWGRALSYQLINDTDGGPAYTFSSIAKDENLIAGGLPLPILVADGRDPGTQIVALNSTVYEFNPWEFGTFDPTVYGFAPTRYLASNFSGGTIPTDGRCVEGFDQSGYVMGTSSTLFNQFLLYNMSAYGVPDIITRPLTAILEALGEDNNDIAQYVPNPFLGYNNASNPSSDNNQLSLVDGGEDLQNIPLHPLLQPLRALDVIFAVDSSADTEYNWPNGTALRASYDRSRGAIANGTLFPPVPDDHTFINLGLNNRPTFFGCDPSNFTLAAGQVVPPLVVYLPNAPYTAASNVSTFTPSYTAAEKVSFIRNGLDAGTQGNGTLDAAWPACVACAVLSRSLARTGTAAPATCASCFSRYCWNGTLDTADRGSYEPPFKIADQLAAESAGAASGPSSPPGRWTIAIAVAAGAVVVVIL